MQMEGGNHGQRHVIHLYAVIFNIKWLSFVKRNIKSCISRHRILSLSRLYFINFNDIDVATW